MVKTLISDYPWYCPFFCLAFAAATTAISYWHNKKLSEISKTKKTILSAIRFTATFFISLLLLSIFIKTKTSRQEKPILAIAIDNSQSIMMRGQQKNDSMKAFCLRINQMCEKLEEKFTIKKFKFGSSLQNGEKLTFDEKNTNFSQMTEELKNTFYNTSLVATVICSDGIYNKGQNPTYTTPKIPSKVYTVGLGDTTKYKNISISKVIYNETAFLANQFPILINVNAQMLNSKQTICEIKHKGNTIFSEKININSNNFSKEISANIEAKEKGLQKYTITLKPTEGEISTLDNTRNIIIDIADDKYKILILSYSPHPDVAAMRNALSYNPSYEIETANIQDFNKNLSAYNLIILVHLPSDEKTKTIAQEIKQKNIPTLYLIGQQTSVNQFNKLNTCLTIDQTGNNFEDAGATINHNFQLFTTENTAQDFFKQTPPLSCPFGNYKLLPGTQILMYQTIKGIETQKPLVAISDPSTARAAIIIGEGLWRWRIDNYKKYQNHEIFDLFIGRIVQFLITKNNKEMFSVESKRIFNEDEPILFSAKVLDETLTTTQTTNITIDITDENNTTKKYKFSQQGNGYFLKTDPLPTGNYTYTAQTIVGSKKLTKKGAFSVSEIKLEAEQLTANHQLLKKMAQTNNGKFFLPDQLDNLETELNQLNVKPIVFTDTATDDIMNKKWPFFIILLLLSAEWFLRKFWGFL